MDTYIHAIIVDTVLSLYSVFANTSIQVRYVLLIGNRFSESFTEENNFNFYRLPAQMSFSDDCFVELYVNRKTFHDE